MDEKVRLQVQGITNNRIESGAYALILKEEGPRSLGIIIGFAEAQSIAVALEGLQVERPLTHDLFVNFAGAAEMRLEEVFIHKVVDGVFYSELVFANGIRIDSRTSDAVALALRMKCEIFTPESLLQEHGIVMEENSNHPADKNVLFTQGGDKEKKHEWLHFLQKNEIEDSMQQAVRDENYEFAKLCQDELLRREKETTE
ncbi:MAG: bifunctional nuclease family protein [Tannerella sp.]|nr:bifunctional nuclease family protein [Tannerella sp.]